jgi:preprotein translocase subunit SecA
MFMDMVYRIKEDTLEKLCWVQVQMEDDIKQVQKPQSENYIMSRGDSGASPATIKRKGKKIGRNDPCPCGSGKKYKKCCGRQ